jgi:hypothetical protein
MRQLRTTRGWWPSSIRWNLRQISSVLVAAWMSAGSAARGRITVGARRRTAGFRRVLVVRSAPGGAPR